MSLTDLIEKAKSFFQIAESHKHEYRVVDGGQISGKRGVRWRQYECSGCTKTIASYNGRMPEHKKVESVENLIKEGYQLK